MRDTLIQSQVHNNWNLAWFNHGLFLKRLAHEYLEEGKKYTKETPVHRKNRSHFARLAIRYWRSGDWYIERHQNV